MGLRGIKNIIVEGSPCAVPAAVALESRRLRRDTRVSKIYYYNIIIGETRKTRGRYMYRDESIFWFTSTSVYARVLSLRISRVFYFST